MVTRKLARKQIDPAAPKIPAQSEPPNTPELQARQRTPLSPAPMSADDAAAAAGTSASSKDKIDRMMAGFSDFEGIMKDATRVCWPPFCAFSQCVLMPDSPLSAHSNAAIWTNTNLRSSSARWVCWRRNCRLKCRSGQR